MKIKNFTPHKFTFFSVLDCQFDNKSKKLILNENATPLFTVEPEPTSLRATLTEKELEQTVLGIPQVDISIDACDPLPELADDEVAVVSFVYMSAAKKQGLDTSKLRTTVPCFLSADGLPHGVVKLSL